MRKLRLVLLGLFVFGLGVGLGASALGVLLVRQDLVIRRDPSVKTAILSREAEVAQIRRNHMQQALEEQIGSYDEVPKRHTGPMKDDAIGLWNRYVYAQPDERNSLVSGSGKIIQTMLDLHRDFLSDTDYELLRHYVDWRARNGLDEFRRLSDVTDMTEFVEWLLAQEYR